MTGDEPPLAAAARASAGSPASGALVLARHYMTLRSDLASLGYAQGWRLPTPPRLGGLWKDQGAALAKSAAEQLAAAGDIINDPLPALIERAFGIDVAIRPLGDGFDGLAAATPDLKLILAAPQPVPARLRFTLAHELGHLLASDDQQIHTDQNIYRTERAESEVRANSFAATLLMPEETLREAVAPGFDTEKFCRLATKLRVSPTSLAIRLESLRLIDAGARDRWRRISGSDAAQKAGLQALNAQLAAESLSTRPPGLLLRDAWAAYEAGDVTLRLFAGLSETTTDALRASLDTGEVDD
ncbi:ImmA/IrrE family metallo-endopeptidase [Micropruina sp.]|uniref:ImmA/IrrE family metallo-endopeptidase n=1 Tax=Micropruina sp. TaxID=2737536 RepID=UPI0039E34E3E